MSAWLSFAEAIAAASDTAVKLQDEACRARQLLADWYKAHPRDPLAQRTVEFFAETSPTSDVTVIPAASSADYAFRVATPERTVGSSRQLPTEGDA